MAFESLGLQSIKVIAAQIMVLDLVLQHVVDASQDRMAHAYQSPLLAAAAHQTVELGREIGAIGVTGGPSGLHQCSAEPAIAWRDPTALAFAGRLVAAGTHSRPG